MLTVRNLPPEPTWRDWLREQYPLLRGLGLSLTAMSCLTILGNQATSDDWYLLQESEGGLITMPVAGGEAACYDRAGDDSDSCIKGTLPRGVEASLLSP